MRPIASLLLLFGASAAPARTAVDHGMWLNLSLQGQTAGHLLYFVDLQPRFNEDASRLGQGFARGGLGWKLSGAISLYGGYHHQVTFLDGAKDRNEERLLGQLSWTIGQVAGGALSARGRIEHRRLSNGDDTGWRARWFTRYAHPLGDPKGVKALVSNELFWALNDTDWGARAGLDQVRTFIGVEVPLKAKTTAELGYLNQVVNDPGGRIRLNHVASLSLVIRP